MGRTTRKSKTCNGDPVGIFSPSQKREKKAKRQWRREESGGPPTPPGAPGARTYLLAAAAGVGLGVRRRAAAAPGRGVKVPGIILVHDPRWGPERKQGVFLPPPSPRPRTGCCGLAPCRPRLWSSLRGCSPTVAGADGRRRQPGNRASRAPRAALLSGSPSATGPAGPPVPPSKSPRVPRSLPCARPPAPARSRSPAGTAGPSKNWKLKKEKKNKNKSPAGHACQVRGPPDFRFSKKKQTKQTKKRRKERLPAGRNFYFLLLEKELRINFLWPTRRRSFGAARTLAGRR